MSTELKTAKQIITPEMKKIYNKKYYEKHGGEIREKLATKVVCELCGRTMTYKNIQKHMSTPLCLSRRETYKKIMDNAAERIEKQKLINDAKRKGLMSDGDIPDVDNQKVEDVKMVVDYLEEDEKRKQILEEKRKEYMAKEAEKYELAEMHSYILDLGFDAHDYTYDEVKAAIKDAKEKARERLYEIHKEELNIHIDDVAELIDIAENLEVHELSYNVIYDEEPKKKKNKKKKTKDEKIKKSLETFFTNYDNIKKQYADKEITKEKFNMLFHDLVKAQSEKTFD